jgi:hypothetical protein
LQLVVVVAFGLLGAFVITASAADRAQVASDDIVLTDTGNTVSSPVVPMDRVTTTPTPTMTARSASRKTRCWSARCASTLKSSQLSLKIC